MGCPNLGAIPIVRWFSDESVFGGQGEMPGSTGIGETDQFIKDGIGEGSDLGEGLPAGEGEREWGYLRTLVFADEIVGGG